MPGYFAAFNVNGRSNWWSVTTVPPRTWRAEGYPDTPLSRRAAHNDRELTVGGEAVSAVRVRG